MVIDPPASAPAPAPTPSVDEGDVVIAARGLGKMYRIYDKPQDRLKQMLLWRLGRHYGREFWALRDVSFEVRRGESVGIIGRNGSGKSTLLQIIAGTLAPSEGEVTVRGRVAALLELGSGFNPEFTGRENVFMNGAILGLSRAEMEARFDEIAAFADIGAFIEQPVKLYSSGMVVRLAFAVASCIDPDVLIVDEALAVGDVAFQARCLEKIKRLTDNGTTTLFVTHDIGTFQNLCQRGYMLDGGRLFAQGRPAQVAMQYYELMRVSEHARQRNEVAGPERGAEVREELQAQVDEIRAKSAEGEYRFGTGAARIVDYVVRNADGAETASLEIGKPFQVTVTVQFHDYVENVALGVMFRNAQGQNLMGMHSYVEHRVSFGAHDTGEQLAITCEQTMLLNPGDYLLSVGLADCRSDYDFTSLDNRSNLAKISVVGKPLGYGLVHTRPHFWVGPQPGQTWQAMAWKDWQEWTLERCRQLAPQARDVLEIGGQGHELRPFLEERERRFTTLNFPTGDICRPTPHPDGAFDLIVAKMTFEHLYDPFGAAAELTRLLVPGGVLLLSTVWAWRYHAGPGFDDYWRFSAAGLAQLFPRLEVVEAGYDLDDRRKDCRLDNVPVDDLGGWREHWYVYLVARRPAAPELAPATPVPYRFARRTLSFTLDEVKAAYEAVLAEQDVQEVVREIMRCDSSTSDPRLIASGAEEERAWPSDERFVASGYYRMMLGRYAFAGAFFCRGADVLDTCCGLGWGARLTAHYARSVTAFDLSPQLVDFCREVWAGSGVSWRAGDATDLAFLGEERYDVALGMEVIEHFTEGGGARYVAEVARVLRPGGVFIGTSAFPVSEQEARQMEAQNPYHLHVFTEAEMLALLRRHFSQATIIGSWMFIAVR